jgi:hypothetical protein
LGKKEEEGDNSWGTRRHVSAVHPYSHMPEVRVRALQRVQNIPIQQLKQTWTIVMQIKPIR